MKNPPKNWLRMMRVLKLNASYISFNWWWRHLDSLIHFSKMTLRKLKSTGFIIVLECSLRFDKIFCGIKLSRNKLVFTQSDKEGWSLFPHWFELKQWTFGTEGRLGNDVQLWARFLIKLILFVVNWGPASTAVVSAGAAILGCTNRCA